MLCVDIRFSSIYLTVSADINSVSFTCNILLFILWTQERYDLCNEADINERYMIITAEVTSRDVHYKIYRVLLMWRSIDTQ